MVNGQRRVGFKPRKYEKVASYAPPRRCAYAGAGEPCRHCRQSAINRPRQLCWSCYYTPGVKELYPSTSKYARRGVGNFSGEAPMPDAPTTAAPGTPEKLAVLEQRAALKQSLFHSHDAGFEGDMLPVEFLKRKAGAA